MVEGEGDFDGAVGKNDDVESGEDPSRSGPTSVESGRDRDEIPEDVEVAQRRHDPQNSNRRESATSQRISPNSTPAATAATELTQRCKRTRTRAPAGVASCPLIEELTPFWRTWSNRRRRTWRALRSMRDVPSRRVSCALAERKSERYGRQGKRIRKFRPGKCVFSVKYNPCEIFGFYRRIRTG